jgi:hypothetical protein
MNLKIISIKIMNLKIILIKIMNLKIILIKIMNFERKISDGINDNAKKIHEPLSFCQ